MSWLIDTNVLSASFNPQRNPVAFRWLQANGSDCWFSCMTLGEIEAGIMRSQRRDPLFADRLRAWQQQIEHDWAGHILPVTAEVAHAWGEIIVAANRKDVDLLIAATAVVHDLTVATRNVSDFAGTGVRLFNPWTGEAFS